MNDNTLATGASFTTLLTIVFIVLKFCNIIDWGWLWVLSPIWIPIVLLILILCITVLFE